MKANKKIFDDTFKKYDMNFILQILPISLYYAFSPITFPYATFNIIKGCF
jgi:hypothetical protein